MQIAPRFAFAQRAQLRVSMIGACAAAFLLSLSSSGLAEEAKKDAAEAIGEGNAVRWLDYYRRERGQDWHAGGDAPSKTPGGTQPREPPPKEAPPPPDKRD
jgi:hypothetical protein